jgi:hypothetical protein
MCTLFLCQNVWYTKMCRGYHYQKCLPDQCTQNVYLTSVHKMFTLSMYTKCLHYQCTQNVYLINVHKMFTLSMYTKCLPYQCTQNVYLINVYKMFYTKCLPYQCTQNVYLINVHKMFTLFVYSKCFTQNVYLINMHKIMFTLQVYLISVQISTSSVYIVYSTPLYKNIVYNLPFRQLHFCNMKININICFKWHYN